MTDCIDHNMVNNCAKEGPWHLGNQTLYDLCSSNFTHDTREKIVAKVWLIGRAYSVAVERRKNKTKLEINDHFYTETIVPNFLSSSLDEKLSLLRETGGLDELALPKVLELHCYLTQLLKTITALDKRSFSSKYLHFHLPSLFFIYDNRAVTALRKLKIKTPANTKLSHGFDKEYSLFVHKCQELTRLVALNFNVHLSPRQLDNLLLQIANNEMLNRNSKS